MRVLGIDTSLRSTGAGVIEVKGSSFRLVEATVVRTPARRKVSECLARLHDGLSDLVDRTKPDAAAVEGAFFSRNVRTAMVLGQARGVAIAVCACRGIPAYEYAPRKVKQAVVGFGGAAKEQVAQMIVRLLALPETPPEDAADALALAICHAHNRTGAGILMPDEI